MSVRVYFHPAAAEEVEAALAWYAERSPRAAGRFVASLAEAIEDIGDAPQCFPAFHACTRRALVRRFPFIVVFRERSGHIEVIAVAHAKRRPGYWRKRL